MSIPGMAQGLSASRIQPDITRRAGAPRARTLSGPPAVFYDVKLIPQPNKTACWAASMAMLVSFRQQQSLTPESLAQQVGRDLRTSYNWDMLEAVKDQYGFQEISLPSNATLYPSPQTWYDWLSTYGPLWVTTIGAPSHAIVVHGISGDLTPAGTTMSILNPWDVTQAFDNDPIEFHPFNPGRAYSQSFEAFASDFGNLELADYGNWRVLYLPDANPGNASVSQALAHGNGRAARPRPNGRVKATFARARELGIADIPSFISDATMTRVQDSSGRVSWELDQLRGVKHPASQVPVPAVAKPLLDARTIRLEDWPCIEAGAEHIQASFTVDWQYDGQALGNIRIANTAASEAADWSLQVCATITDYAADYPPGAPQYAALNVTFNYQFTRTDGSDAHATTELKLFGNGTFNQTSRWAQQSPAS